MFGAGRDTTVYKIELWLLFDTYVVANGHVFYRVAWESYSCAFLDWSDDPVTAKASPVSTTVLYMGNDVRPFFAQSTGMW